MDISKKYAKVNFYDLITISKFMIFIHNKEIEIKNNQFKIIDYSISTLFDNTTKEYIFIVDIIYLFNLIENSGNLENIFTNLFNFKSNTLESK